LQYGGDETATEELRGMSITSHRRRSASRNELASSIINTQWSTTVLTLSRKFRHFNLHAYQLYYATSATNHLPPSLY